jgi:hypothetical protein
LVSDCTEIFKVFFGLPPSRPFLRLALALRADVCDPPNLPITAAALLIADCFILPFCPLSGGRGGCWLLFVLQF